MSGFQPKFASEVPATARPWRRVVTGERDGRSIVAIDDAICPFRMGVEGASGIVVTDMWRTEPDVDRTLRESESCSLPLTFGPPRGGTVVQMLEWPPDRDLFGTDDPASAKAATTHRTMTVDYVYVISGEIHVMLDEGEVCLRTGDTLIQRATQHGWSNRGNAPCRMFVVMLDIERAIERP